MIIAMTDTLFYNVWRTDSPEAKASLLEAMRAEAPRIAAKPGFRSMVVFEGEDGRILVEGRWASRAAYEAAIATDAASLESRRALEAFGTAEPALFHEAFRVGSPQEGGST